MIKTTRGLGCLILFAVPFAAAGLFVGFLTARMLWSWAEIRDWQEVPAQIVQTDLISNSGDDTTTYKVEARYRYELQGLTYENDRVGLSFGSDNIGSYHQDRYAELQRYRSTGEPFRCFVNPGEPQDSILYREMRWGLFSLMSAFAAIFAGAGFGFIAAGLWATRRQEEDLQLVKQHPSQPWQWKKDWSNGRIPATGKSQFLVPGIMAVFWNLISTPLLFFLPEEILERGNYLALLGLLFPLVGMGLMIWAIRAFIRWKKFGDSVFEMSTFPGVIGGQLVGRILTSVDIKPADGFHLGLDSVNRVTSGSGDDRSTREQILWQTEEHLQRESAEYDPTRSEIPVRFAIPYSAQPTDDSDADNEYLWRLQVSADVPGVDYHANFLVPVFRTEDSTPDGGSEDQDKGVWPAETAAPVDLSQHGIRSDLLPTGARRLTMGAARHKGPATMLTLFMVLWLGFNYLLIHLDAPVFFAIVWGLFSLLIVLGALDLWFERRTIEVHPERLVLAGGIFGLGKTRTVQRSEIQEISPIRGMQSGQKLYYRIQITTLDDRTHIAATKLENLSLARALIDRLE